MFVFMKMKKLASLKNTRPIPFYDFVLFVVLSLFTDGSPNVGRIVLQKK